MSQKTEIIISAKDETRGAVTSAVRGLGQISAAGRSVSDSLSGMFTGIASGFAVAGFTRVIKSAADLQDRITELRDSTGLSVEALSGLGYAAKLSGSDLESAAALVNKLSTEIGKNPEKFRQVGISAKDPIEALKQLADLFVSIEDPQQRAAVAAAALGKGWQSAAPLLAQGGQQIGDLIAKGQRLTEITRETTEQSAKFNDGLDELAANAQAAAVKFANVFIPSLAGTTKEMNEAISKGDKLEALLRGFAGIGKLPFDALFSDVQKGLTDFSKEGAIREKARELASLQNDLQKLNKSGGGLLNRWLYGEKADLEQRILVAQNQLAALQKYGEKVFAKNAAAAPATQKPDDKGVQKFLGNEDKKTGFGKSPLQKQAEEYERLIKTVQDRISMQKLELDSSGKLTAAQRDYAKFLNDVRDGSLKLTSAQQEKIETLYQEAVALENLSAQMEEVAKHSEEINGLRERWLSVIDPLYEYKRELAELEKLSSANALSAEELQIATEKLQERFAKIDTSKAKDALDEFNEYAVQAARSIQDSLAEFIFNPFDKGTKGMLKSFGEMLQKMASQAIAADISKYLFGDLSKGVSNGGGALSSVFGWFGSLFASANGNAFGPRGVQAFANGGAFSNSIVNQPTVFPFANGIGLMGEAGPEAIMPLKRMPNGRLGVESGGGGAGNTVNITVHVPAGTAPEMRRAAGAGAKEALAAFTVAQRYA